MFTGLVQALGTVTQLTRRSDALVVRVRAPALIAGPQRANLVVGDSISHDGACLTITALHGDDYEVLVGAETLRKTTLGALRVGQRLNLEPALRIGDKLGGHWVTGHIDGTGRLAAKRDLGANIVLVVHCAPELLRYIVAKGSIGLHGVSLTVNTVDAEGFAVAIIPHTASHTTLGDLTPGALVNLEVDILAKHVEKLLAGRQL